MVSGAEEVVGDEDKDRDEEEQRNRAGQVQVPAAAGLVDVDRLFLLGDEGPGVRGAEMPRLMTTETSSSTPMADSNCLVSVCFCASGRVRHSQVPVNQSARTVKIGTWPRKWEK